MFLPLGFGGRLKFFPIATILISLVCIVWSFQFFESQKKVTELTTSELALEYNKQLVTFMAAATGAKECGENLDNKDVGLNLSTGTCFGNVGLKIQALQGKQAKDYPAEYKTHPDYNELVRIESAYLSQIRGLQKKLGYLSADNLNLTTLTRATFTHGGYLHLISNLIFIIFFGVWVEKRIKALKYLLVFFLGSVAGFSVHLLSEPNLPVLGASAGVYTLVGLFLVLFFYKRVEFLFVFFPVIFKRVYLPNKYIIPLVFIAGELAFFVTGAATGISHGAHIGGLVFGLLVGLIIRKSDKLPEGFIFKEELKPAELIFNDVFDGDDDWQAINSIIEHNPQNWKTLVKMLELFDKKEIISLNKSHEKSAHKALIYLAHKARDNDGTITPEEFFDKIPEEYLSKNTLAVFKNQALTKSADTLANNKKYSKAQLLYKFALSKNRSSGNKLRIQNSIDKIDRITGKQDTHPTMEAPDNV